MTSASNTSGTTHTTMTLLDTDDGSDSIGGGSSLLSNGDGGDRSNSTTPSLISNTSCLTYSSTRSVASSSNGHFKIFNYKHEKFVEYDSTGDTCEEICIHISKELKILPVTRLLFGLRVFDSEFEWAVPGQPLRPNKRYCFRMRFKVPALSTQLQSLDYNAYEYLYRQMRYDMEHENIPEISYPAKKNNVTGLAVVDMHIDLLEKKGTVESIENNYKRYLPRKILKEHKYFVKSRVCNTFRSCRSKNVNDIDRIKRYYVVEIHQLAPNYLMERYTAFVNNIPNEEQTSLSSPCNGNASEDVRVKVRLDLYDNSEPGVKISRDGEEWTLLAKFENIFALYKDGGKTLIRLEITGFPNGYAMKFGSQTEVEAFITYLGGYIRLTSKWLLDLCVQYPTPSLEELKHLRCHGPIGGSFSFAKIREKRDNCGTYILRQCEKDYNTYYIDINTKYYPLHPERCRTETFKISRISTNEWTLFYNDELKTFDSLNDLAQFIPTESEQKFRIPPSEYDKPPLLLICLPKNLQSKKTETELSEAELQRKRAQIFDPKFDLQWYKNTITECEDGKMKKLRADWIQQGSIKDVPVTLKWLKSDAEFPEFMKLANTWSQIYSPQFIKLYGLTLSTPYTMIMEYSSYGPLNEFLLKNKKIPTKSLLDVVLGLVRGIVYLREYDIIHGYIRCWNLYVTKFNADLNVLEAKIADPGFPRPYKLNELPWIPFEYYKDMEAAKKDVNAETWAFATTVWEILARGQSITSINSEKLSWNYNHYGGILPPPNEECLEDLYKTLMDGWSKDVDKRFFNHQEIFSRLISAKEKCSSNYTRLDSNAELNSDASSELNFPNEYNSTETGAGTGLNNGFSSGELASCDKVPLLRSEHRLHNNHQPFSNPIGNHKLGRRNYFDSTPSVVELPNGGKLIYTAELGEGHYGIVYKGELRYDSGQRETVAIKTLKSVGPNSAKFSKDFQREIEIMKALNHPNIVKIKQCLEEPISIIMEFMGGGSFLDYLSSRKPNLTNEKLLKFALDIAKGMDYLRNVKIIHRDLAARNILVDLQERMKISDFGLAQVANADGYYFSQSNREIPIKWYSPESIKTMKFSFQSDVWSYGVTLFEMFSRGEVPYLEPEKEIPQEEFLNRLDRGERLRKPERCPDIVYEKLMLPSWHENPKKRPTFEQLVEEIQSIINESGEAI